jgi:hypothetical protein
MSDLSILSEFAAHGLQTIMLENEWLRATVPPEAGAKIYQVQYKPLHTDLVEPSGNCAGEALFVRQLR